MSIHSSHKSKARLELMSFVHIVVAGNIGAGKTTLTKLLARHYAWSPYYERVDNNPFLEDFYKDMARWAFTLQVFFLSHRVEDHRLIAERRKSAVQDRSLSEDALIFARNLAEMGQMSPREWESYRRLYEQAHALLRPPDLVIYLRRSVAGLSENIQHRGRGYEADIPLDYLARLNGFYEEWIAKERAALLIVDADRTDFLENGADFRSLVGQINCAFDQGELFGDPEPAPVDERFILRRADETMPSGKMLGGIPPVR
jgi:deoxyadenosine/deoxycytidine kinase